MQVESFWASHQPADEIRIEVFGTEGGAKLNPLTLYRTEAGAPQDVSVSLPQGHDVWDAMAGHLIECILDGKASEAPLRHGLVVQEMLEGLLRSAEECKEVRLD
jgi:predicted dehydrogenase